MRHVLQNVFDPVHAAWEGDKRSRGSRSRKKKDFPLEIRPSGRVSYANATCLVVSSVTTIDGGNSPSSPLGRRQLSLWLKPSLLHAKQTKRQNQERKCKKMDLQRWDFFFFNRIKYRPSFYNFQELQTRNSPVLFSICTQHERAGSPVTKVNSWPQQKTVFSDIMSVWNKPIMQTRSRVVIMEPCDGDLKLWKFPRTFQTGLCRRGKSNRPVFLNPSWWQTCDTPLNVRSLNTGLFL